MLQDEVWATLKVLKGLLSLTLIYEPLGWPRGP